MTIVRKSSEIKSEPQRFNGIICDKRKDKADNDIGYVFDGKCVSQKHPIENCRQRS